MCATNTFYLIHRDICIRIAILGKMEPLCIFLSLLQFEQRSSSLAVFGNEQK